MAILNNGRKTVIFDGLYLAKSFFFGDYIPWIAKNGKQFDSKAELENYIDRLFNEYIDDDVRFEEWVDDNYSASQILYEVDREGKRRSDFFEEYEDTVRDAEVPSPELFEDYECDLLDISLTWVDDEEDEDDDLSSSARKPKKKAPVKKKILPKKRPAASSAKKPTQTKRSPPGKKPARHGASCKCASCAAKRKKATQRRNTSNRR